MSLELFKTSRICRLSQAKALLRMFEATWLVEIGQAGPCGNREGADIFTPAIPQVKQAYRVLCKEYHPDLSAGAHKAANEVKFKQINEAYNFIHSGHKVGPTAAYHHSAAGGSTWAKKGKGISNRAVAALLVLPLLAGGVRFALWYSKVDEYTGRKDGIMNPPVNDFVSDIPRGPTQAALAKMAALKATRQRYQQNSESQQ